MKRLSTLLLAVMLMATASWAQKITVKGFRLLPRDLAARENPRTDNYGRDCALIKVDVVGIKDLTFDEAIGNVAFKYGEYEVYVPASINTLHYHYSGNKLSSNVNLASFGVDIEGKKVYQLQFETSDKLRTAIFSVSPLNTRLTLNGKVLNVDSEGFASTDLPIGTYNFSASAPGYDSQDGKITLNPENISTMTNVDLDETVFPVEIRCETDSAILFIDDVAYGSATDANNTWKLQLPNGKHSIRLARAKYYDAEDNIVVNNAPVTESLALKPIKLKVIKHNEERSHTRMNVRNCGYWLFGGDLFDKDKHEHYKFGIRTDVAFLQHFWGAFALSEGFNFGLQIIDHKYKENFNEDLKSEHAYISKSDMMGDVALYMEVPLQIGFSIPFGKYNRHMISVLGGMYGKYAINLGDDWDEDSSSSSSSSDSETYDYWDYGLRGTLRLDIRHFNISANISNSLDSKGLFFGLSVGWRFYM